MLKKFDITLQAIWPITKFLVKRDGAKTPNAGYGHLDLKIQASGKTNVIAFLSGKLSRHNLCYENQGWMSE